MPVAPNPDWRVRDRASPAHDGAPRRPQLEHVPALDGLRGVAVLLVLLYHGGVTWLGGGFLGVEAFFVLSGFLITSLLVAEWGRSSTVRLGAFWARRARRLLPALFCVVLAVGVYEAIGGPARAIPGLEGDGISALFYYGNWHEILADSSYFVATGPVSPLQHTWSLAIEEQFYLVWPLLLLARFKLAGRRTRSATGRRRLLLGLCLASCAGAVASATEMALLYAGGTGVDRVYYGTDTRAQPILIGAALAFLLAYLHERGAPARHGRRRSGAAGRFVLGMGGIAGAAGLIFASYRVTGSSPDLYRFGFLVVDVAVATMIAAAVLVPGSPSARLLSTSPLRSVGIISYGLYLWHFPLYQWMTVQSTGLAGWKLLALRLAASGGVAVVSYFLVEQPVRRRRVPRWLLVPLAPGATAAALVSLVVATTLDTAPVVDVRLPPPPPLPTASTQTASTQVVASCTLQLTDNSNYFLAPAPPSRYNSDFFSALATHNTDFGDREQATFHTCPPKRVLFIGDSIAFSLGFGMMAGEKEYGVEIGGAPDLGCTFNTAGDISDDGGHFIPNYAPCATKFQTWAHDVALFHPDAVVVEMGWRDSFDWLVNGQVEHVGQATFDASVQKGVELVLDDLGKGGVPILFLSVPWGRSPPGLDGSEPPQGTAQRHVAVNDDITKVVSRHPGQAQVLDLDSYISPGNHYEASVNGHLCRYDGVHFTPSCAALLEPYVLGTVVKMIATDAHGPSG